MDRYQDSFVPGGGTSGERDCRARWDVIADHLPQSGVMLDIGSNLGYFGLRATHENPNLAVLSIEADAAIAERQRSLIEQNKNDRMVLLQGTLGASACETWSSTCDAVDTTLLLAILHWMDDPERVVKAFSSMSSRLIAEVPHPDDMGACGQEKLAEWSDPVAWFAEQTGRPARLLGRMTRHTSTTPSYVVLVDGPIERRPTVPYWDSTYDHPQGRDYRITQDGSNTELHIRGEQQQYVPGLNIVSLQRLGRLVWPEPATWESWYHTALDEAPGHPDPLPHNAIWTARGLKLIDDEGGPILASPTDGLRALKVNLAAWAKGESVSGSVVVRELTAFQRARRTRVGRFLAELIPTSVRQALVRQRRQLAESWRKRRRAHASS